MTLNDKVYELLKWASLIALPALAVFLTPVLPIFEIEPGPTVVVVNATALFLGTLIGVSQSTINRKAKHVLQADEEDQS